MPSKVYLSARKSDDSGRSVIAPQNCKRVIIGVPNSQLTTNFSAKYQLTTIFWANSQLTTNFG